MPLPSSGLITLAKVRAELAASGTISLGSSATRTLAGKPTGTVRLSDLYGKSNSVGQISGTFLTQFAKTGDSTITIYTTDSTIFDKSVYPDGDPETILQSAAINAQFDNLIQSPCDIVALTLTYLYNTGNPNQPEVSLRVYYRYNSSSDYTVGADAVKRVKAIFVEGIKIEVPADASLGFLAQDLGKAKTSALHQLTFTPSVNLNSAFESWYLTLNRPPIIGFDV